MFIYYFNKNGDMRLRMFNGLQDLVDKYEAGELADMQSNSSNFAVKSGNFANDRLTDLTQVIAVLQDLKSNYEATPEAFASCDFELEAVPKFKGDDFWKNKLNKAVDRLLVSGAPDNTRKQIVEEAFATLEYYTAVGSIADSVAYDAVKRVLEQSVEEE